MTSWARALFFRWLREGACGLMAVPTLWLFDRWDERIGTLPTLGAMTHSEELGGEGTIELDCLVATEKGDRVVGWDAEGRYWPRRPPSRRCGPC